jgi:hypothetical protein
MLTQEWNHSRSSCLLEISWVCFDVRKHTDTRIEQTYVSKVYLRPLTAFVEVELRIHSVITAI